MFINGSQNSWSLDFGKKNYYIKLLYYNQQIVCKMWLQKVNKLSESEILKDHLNYANIFVDYCIRFLQATHPDRTVFLNNYWELDTAESYVQPWHTKHSKM